MTPFQSKLARSALGWGIRDMPAASQVASSTVNRFEKGEKISKRKFDTLRAAYERNGIKFLSEGEVALGEGICLKARR